MVDAFSQALIRFLKVPPEPPAPFGEEQSLRVFRAAPQYYTYQLILWSIGQAVVALLVLAGFAGLLAGAFGVRDDFAGTALAFLAFVALGLYAIQLFVTFVALRLQYKMRWYKVTDRSLRIREGVFQVREMTMTFMNIQNIEITQGPIQRWLGISDIQVHTAGGAGGAARAQGGQNGHQLNMHVGYFRGVDNAAEIFATMQERLRRSRSAGLGDHDDPESITRTSSPSDAPSEELIAAATSLLNEVRQLRFAAETQ